MPDKTTTDMSDLPDLMHSLSYTPTDDRVPKALRDGAEEIERLRTEIVHCHDVMGNMWRAARRVMREALTDEDVNHAN